MIRQGVVNKLFLVATCLMAANAYAQSEGVQVGNTTLYPSIGVTLGYDDNVTLDQSASVSSYYYQISPALRWQAGNSRNRVAVTYQIDYADYEDSDFDDFIDHSLQAQWIYDPTERSLIDLAGQYIRGHDGRGEGVREFLPETLPLDVDEFDLLGIDALYRYGADGARGRLELSAGLSDKSYRNNRELTAQGDYDEFRVGAAFQWRVAPKTRFLVEAGLSEVDYRVSDLDGDESYLGIGAAWEASAKTEGRVSVRYLEKDFDSGAPGYSGEAWKVGVRWSPKQYSVVELSTSRLTDEALGASNLVVRDTVDLSWRHEWRSRFATFVDAGIEDEDFDPGPRIDDAFYYGAGFSYQARDWLYIGFSYRHSDRDSSLSVFDYERSAYLLSFELAP